MTIDVIKDRLVFMGKSYSLADFREYMLDYYPHIVQQYAVKMINGKFTFDWETIYLRSKQSGILIRYICKNFFNH